MLSKPFLTGAEAKRQLRTKFFAKLSYKKACGRRGKTKFCRKFFAQLSFKKAGRKLEDYSPLSKMGVPWLSSTRPAWMWARASAGDSFTCSPERMFFTAHRPAAISSSPRKMT